MKKRAVALALAAVMVMGAAAMAAGTEKTITVTPMALNVNGQTVTPTKSDGAPAEVFSYEGATYAPLRYLTELNGNQVMWDKDDPNTARITTGTALTYSDTIAWDGEYDVVVAGFGAAGAVAAITAADAGAKVLLTEKAPKGEAGGNSRVSHQIILGVIEGGDPERMRTYYHGLWEGRDYTEEVLDAYIDGMTDMKNILVNDLGANEEEIFEWRAAGLSGEEYPEIPGGEYTAGYTLHTGYADGYFWQHLRGQIADRPGNIDLWYESPATHLIQDPVTKAILGITIQRDGKEINIKANKGVILATGGFENNPAMLDSYLGISDSHPVGGTYNTGDGIYMAMEVGADLWHMNNYTGATKAGSLTFPTEEGQRGVLLTYLPALYTGSIITVSGEGSRYVQEDAEQRHGHVYRSGEWRIPNVPATCFFVFDQPKYEELLASNSIAKEYQDKIIRANTISELAQAAGMDAAVLERTITRFNGYAKAGEDLEFDRSPESMTAFSKSGPYYAIQATKAILNTQGGPRRNENAEILDTNGNPIPHLYSAGELGGVTAGLYQGAGNLAECVIFGKIAGQNAATSEPAVSAPLTAATSNLTYTPGKVSDIGGKGPEIATGANEYVGVSHNGMGGDLYVKVTVEGGKITKVEIVEHHETAGISDPAREQLPAAIVKANSAEVDTVSGATITSKAIKEAVTDALSQVK